MVKIGWMDLQTNTIKIECLASGSTGNCYLVKMGGSCFILDAGIPIESIVSHVNLNDVDFAFISHSHKDHSLSTEKLALRGVSILRGNLIRDFAKINPKADFGPEFQVFCFPVEHGDEYNAGIIVYYNKTKECLLYATDFNICKYDIQAFLNSYIPQAKLTNIMVECNFIEELVDGKEDIKTKRQINTHMGLNGLQLFLGKLDLSKCQEIILIHMSQGYGDDIWMPSTIYSKYKIKTGICYQWGGIDYIG